MPGERIIGGAFTLRPGSVVRALVYFYMFLNVFIGIIGVLTIWNNNDFYIFIGIMGFMALLNMLLFIAVRNIKVDVDNTGIAKYGVFGGVKKVWWHEVQKIKIHQRNKNLEITGLDKRISVANNFIGYNDLVEYIHKTITPSLIQES
jgi:hypothetical protein